MSASTAPLPLYVIAGVPAGIRALCRAAPSWRGSGRLPDTAFDLPARAVLVLEGVVLVSAVRPSGRVVALALLAPGDLWMDEPERRADEGPAVRVDALGRSMVALPDRAAVLRATASPAAAGWVADSQLRRALAAERRAASILSNSVEERILAVFAELARAGCAVLEDGRTEIAARISQERLAWMAGASRESANRVVASLIARGALARVAGRYVLPVGFSLGVGAS